MRSNVLGSADWQEMVGMKRKFYSPWKGCFSFCFPPNLAWTVLSTFLDLVKSTEISAFLQQGQHDLWYCWQTTASHAGQEECSKDLQIKCILLPPDPTAHSGSSQNPQNKSRMCEKKNKLKTKAHFNVDTLLFVHLLLPCSRSMLADATCWRKGGYGWHLQSKGLELCSDLPSSGWIWNAIAGTPLEICMSRNARRSCKISLNGRKGVQCPLLFIASAVSLFLHFGFKMLNVATMLP